MSNKLIGALRYYGKKTVLPATAEIKYHHGSQHFIKKAGHSFPPIKIAGKHPETGKLFILFKSSNFQLFTSEDQRRLELCKAGIHLKDVDGGHQVLEFFSKEERIVITVFSNSPDALYYSDDSDREPIQLESQEIKFLT